MNAYTKKGVEGPVATIQTNVLKMAQIFVTDISMMVRRNEQEQTWTKQSKKTKAQKRGKQ